MSASPTTTEASPPSRWRWWLRQLRNLTLAYVGVLIVLLFFENRLIYFPSSEWLPPPDGVTVEDVFLQSADGNRIHAWWCPASGDDVLIYCHGNGGNVSWWGHAAGELVQKLDTSVLVFDYPGYGKSEGKPSEAGCYAAGDAAYDWVAERVPAKRIVLFGMSLGGGVAVDLAVRREHRALVLVRAFTSIPDMAQKQLPFLPVRWLVRHRFDNLEKIGRCPRPIFIAHGDSDSLVPLSQGQRLFEAAPEPKRFFLMPGLDHNDRLREDFYRELGSFLKGVRD